MSVTNPMVLLVCAVRELFVQTFQAHITVIVLLVSLATPSDTAKILMNVQESLVHTVSVVKEVSAQTLLAHSLVPVNPDTLVTLKRPVLTSTNAVSHLVRMASVVTQPSVQTPLEVSHVDAHPDRLETRSLNVLSNKHVTLTTDALVMQSVNQANVNVQHLMLERTVDIPVSNFSAVNTRSVNWTLMAFQPVLVLQDTLANPIVFQAVLTWMSVHPRKPVVLWLPAETLPDPMNVFVPTHSEAILMLDANLKAKKEVQ